jgi:hypothetical protein
MRTLYKAVEVEQENEMKKVIIALLICGFLPLSLFAGSVYLEGPDTAVPAGVDGTFEVEVYLEDFYVDDTQRLDAIQLSLLFSTDPNLDTNLAEGSAELNALRNAAFTLAPATPEVSFAGKKIVNHGLLGTAMTGGWEDVWDDNRTFSVTNIAGGLPADIDGKQLAFTATYEYDATTPAGTYYMYLEPYDTVLSDQWGDKIVNYPLYADSVTIADTEPIPEPATIALLGIGIIGLISYSRKRSRK